MPTVPGRSDESTYEGVFDGTFWKVAEGHCPNCERALDKGKCPSCGLSWMAIASPGRRSIHLETEHHRYVWSEVPRDAG